MFIRSVSSSSSFESKNLFSCPFDATEPDEPSDEPNDEPTDESVSTADDKNDSNANKTNVLIIFNTISVYNESGCDSVVFYFLNELSVKSCEKQHVFKSVKSTYD